MAPDTKNSEQIRLDQDARREVNWKRWGPYLAERQWGTVREDYSSDGDAWNYFPHEHARSRAFRWGEDGLLGFTDRECRLCFNIALWNENDPILKERLFGLTGPQGNHGEDCKELYYYLDSTPTHSYFKALYKYPQGEYPYRHLEEENARRGLNDPEYELMDTGIFDENRYFDVLGEYAKDGPDDILIRITLSNRGPDPAVLHVLPTLWFRNNWIWGCHDEGCGLKPWLHQNDNNQIETDHESLGKFLFSADIGPEYNRPKWLFCENETNNRLLWQTDNYTPYVKDAFHRAIVNGETDAVCPMGKGTKVAAHYKLNIASGDSVTLRLRLRKKSDDAKKDFGKSFDKTIALRIAEADRYYSDIIPQSLSEEEQNTQRQAYAGMLHSKQFYYYAVKDWIKGDPNFPEPSEQRKTGRNADWQHLFNRDIISMPDKWEYPWYAAWDLAFHMIPFARIDPQFAKDQLLLMLREWYMNPNGQIPAYEFALGDVNPPVHAWACWRIYKMTGKKGSRDHDYLARVFHKLLINFTWWVNRKDPEGNNLFSGGFLGLDNIGVFDRSKPLPAGAKLAQADGTAWMAFYCATMLSIALELAQQDSAYDGVASKFFEHYVAIADAMNCFGGSGLWDEEDGFYYDQLDISGHTIPLKIRSVVGLTPLYAVNILRDDIIDALPAFKKRMKWFLNNRKDLASHISYFECAKTDTSMHLLAIPSRPRLERVLSYLLDENEFLSPYGIRSLSKYHQDHPFKLKAFSEEYEVHYVPGEARSYLFGGNSNWRGPIWFPINFLIIESLEKFHFFYGDSFKIECPTGSGNFMTLEEVAKDISKRLIRLFLPDSSGNCPSHGNDLRYSADPHFKNLKLFYEYFHGDTGSGAGASHQTGWTGLVAKLIEDIGKQGETAF